MLRRSFAGWVALGVLIGVAPARLLAGGLSAEPFDYRLTLSFDRLTAFTDVTARSGASMAHPLGSSVNPAAKDMLRDGPFSYTYLGTATENFIALGSGAIVQGESTTQIVRLPDAGTFSATIIRTDMLDGSSRSGDDFGLCSNELVVGYSRHVSPTLTLGAELHYLDSYLSIWSPGPFGLLRRSTDSDGLTLLGGALWMPTKQWSFGLMAGGGGSHAGSDLTVADPRVAPVPFGLNASTDIWNVNVRGGVGYKPVESVGLYADLQYRHLASGTLGTADVGRVFAGAEWFATPWLALRTGTSLDTAAKASVSAGVGLYAFDPFLIEFAYAYNNFPEVTQEFGRAHVVSISVVWRF